MEVIFSEQNKPFTGNIGRAWGYFIVGRKSKNGHVTYCSQRSRHSVPPDGHWLFILSCAELAHMGFKIADIRVSRDEVRTALLEAGHHTAMWHLKLNIYDARDILNLKTTFGL